ncbi:MAG: hypothetical protein CME69_08090 [Halobacteriovorax sp.]|nr:hypothetical protein [Halobacteriovorax sp.]
MKTIKLITFLLSFVAFAHDGGHGPSISDESMQGGKVAAVINYKEVNEGTHAKMLLKGELVVEGLTVKLYLYDKKMNEISLNKYPKTIEAIQIERGKEANFQLNLSESKKFYIGKRTKNKRVPYNIDVKIKKADITYFAAFDGLDK